MRFLKLLLVTCYLLIANTAFSLTIPSQPKQYINDYAHLLTGDVVQDLNARLQQFERKTTTQIVVAIFPSLENQSLEDFTTRLEEKWQIGHKGKDNGVLLVIFAKEHQVRIEVGYGLESVLPDALAGQIIQTDIVPNFKHQQYAVGLNQALTRIMQVTVNADSVTSAKTDHAFALEYYILGGFLLFVAFSFFVRSFRRTGKDKNLTTPRPLNPRDANQVATKPSRIGSILSFILMLLAFLPRGGGGRNDDDNFRGGGGRSGGGGANGQW